MTKKKNDRLHVSDVEVGQYVAQPKSGPVSQQRMTPKEAATFNKTKK